MLKLILTAVVCLLSSCIIEPSAPETQVFSNVSSSSVYLSSETYLYTESSSDEYTYSDNSSENFSSEHSSSNDAEYGNTPYSSMEERESITYANAFDAQFINFILDAMGNSNDKRTLHYSILEPYEELLPDTIGNVYTRGVYGYQTDDQLDMINYWDTFTLSFGVLIKNIHDEYGVNAEGANAFFKEQFLNVGTYHSDYSNYTISQPYMYEIGSSDRILIITDIKDISDKENMLYVSGTFSGGLESPGINWEGQYTNGPISNGTFSIILEN